MCLPQVPPHSEQVFLMSRKPEFVTTFLTTAGVILDNFHLKSFLSSAGSETSLTSLWCTKVMVGGTLENSDLFNGGAEIWTRGVVLMAKAFLSGFFSVSPSEKDSRFSPTKEGVFEQTEEPVNKKNDKWPKKSIILSKSQVFDLFEFSRAFCAKFKKVKNTGDMTFPYNNCALGKKRGKSIVSHVVFEFSRAFFAILLRNNSVKKRANIQTQPRDLSTVIIYHPSGIRKLFRIIFQIIRIQNVN